MTHEELLTESSCYGDNCRIKWTALH